MRRSGWLAAAIGAASGVALAAVAAGVEDLVNGGGRRAVAGPVLWGLGGGLGLSVGTVLAAVWTRRSRWITAAAVLGAVPLLVLLVVAYNDERLNLGDQFIGTAFVVVIPATIGAMVLGFVALPLARLLGARRRSRRARGPLDRRGQTNSAIS